MKQGQFVTGSFSDKNALKKNERSTGDGKNTCTANHSVCRNGFRLLPRYSTRIQLRGTDRTISANVICNRDAVTATTLSVFRTKAPQTWPKTELVASPVERFAPENDDDDFSVLR